MAGCANTICNRHPAKNVNGAVKLQDSDMARLNSVQGMAAPLTAALPRIGGMFGRNTLLSLASFMLLVISGYATWHGMRDFIVGVSTNAPSDHSTGLSVSNDILVIIVVSALTFLMWLALGEALGSQRSLRERLISFPLYLFLAVWSVGFGYGFWWSLIAGEEATRTGLSGLQEDARDAGATIAARLDAVRAQLDNVVSWSEGQMAREESSGGSCGTSSGAGRGPLYNARRGVKDSVASLRDGISRSWLQPIQADLELLQQSAARLDGATVEDRQRRFEARASEVRGKARAIAARSNELGSSTATEMRALGNAVSVAPGKPGFSCFDPTLGERLKAAADQASQPAQLKLREAAFSEGPAGVANAIKNLWENIGAYVSSLPRYLLSGGKTNGDTTKSGDPITGRDLIALLATIGIDLGLLALTALNPPPAVPARRNALASNQARLRLPDALVIKQLAGAIETAIARAPGADLEWARRHFISHGACSYFVIPNLYSVAKEDDAEELRALAVNQLAGVFRDLELVRPLTEAEYRKVGKEEMRMSFADLAPLRAGAERARSAIKPSTSLWHLWLDRTDDRLPVTEEPARIRNHGLLSKAQRALAIAGWSPSAQKDVEVFRLVDCEGLTPLLTLLNEATLAKGVATIEHVRSEQARIEREHTLAIADQR
jgi:hypothetical protein